MNGRMDISTDQVAIIYENTIFGSFQPDKEVDILDRTGYRGLDQGFHC